MRYRLECPANRYVFKSRLNCSESIIIDRYVQGRIKQLSKIVCKKFSTLATTDVEKHHEIQELTHVRNRNWKPVT